jgi:hypothetical protein
MHTETCKKYSVTVIFYCIFHIKPQCLHVSVCQMLSGVFLAIQNIQTRLNQLEEL